MGWKYILPYLNTIAAARSVLTVGRIKGKPYTRAIVQGKNNLAPEGQANNDKTAHKVESCQAILLSSFLVSSHYFLVEVTLG